jgi:hypothetical protein
LRNRQSKQAHTVPSCQTIRLVAVVPTILTGFTPERAVLSAKRTANSTLYSPETGAVSPKLLKALKLSMYLVEVHEALNTLASVEIDIPVAPPCKW